MIVNMMCLSVIRPC